jgi:FkbM family methyltransferase
MSLQGSAIRRFALALGRSWAMSTPTERGGYRLARALRRMIPRDEWSDLFEVAPGCRIRLDIAGYPDCSMAIGAYELDTVRLVRRILRPGDHFIDVGANIGYITLAAASIVGTRGRIDSIEPLPANFERLERNIAASGVAEFVRARAVAASDREGTITLHFPQAEIANGNHGLTSAYLPAEIRHGSVEIPCVRLDSLLQGATPKLIKLDVEGAEPLAIAGLRGLLTSATPPHLILEVNPDTARNAGFPIGEAVRLALDAQPSYQMWTIGWGARRVHELREIDSLGQANIWLRPA